MDENPRGPKVCICQYGRGNFVCSNLMSAEDGLCDGCRQSHMCTDEREFLKTLEEA